MPEIKVAIADDHRLFTEGLTAIINRFKGMKVVMTAENGQILIDKLRKSAVKPDVILLDLKMPEMGGIEATQKILKLYPNIRIVILSMQEEDIFIYQLLQRGALGYLTKNADPSEVERAIRAVHEDGYYFTDKVIRIMHKHIRQGKGAFIRFIKEGKDLSARETEILRMICMEISNQEIAKNLNLSIRTVEGFRKNIMNKTGSKTSIGLVIYALKHGIIKY